MDRMARMTKMLVRRRRRSRQWPEEKRGTAARDATVFESVLDSRFRFPASG